MIKTVWPSRLVICIYSSSNLPPRLPAEHRESKIFDLFRRACLSFVNHLGEQSVKLSILGIGYASACETLFKCR